MLGGRRLSYELVEGPEARPPVNGNRARGRDQEHVTVLLGLNERRQGVPGVGRRILLLERGGRVPLTVARTRRQLIDGGKGSARTRRGCIEFRTLTKATRQQ
jgi:hypothetical protein